MSWSRRSRAIPLLPLWAVRPVQSLSACTRVHFTFFYHHVRLETSAPRGSLLSASSDRGKGSGDLPTAVFILVVGARIFILFKWDLKTIFKLRNLYKIFNSVLSWIHSIRSLSNIETSVMCKWWLLLRSID